MAQYKPWRDKSYLHKMYSVKRMTIDQIADDCKKMGYSVTPMTIYNNLKDFGLLRTNRNLGPRSVGGKHKRPGQNGPRKKGYYG